MRLELLQEPQASLTSREGIQMEVRIEGRKVIACQAHVHAFRILLRRALRCRMRIEFTGASATPVCSRSSEKAQSRERVDPVLHYASTGIKLFFIDPKLAGHEFF